LLSYSNANKYPKICWWWFSPSHTIVHYPFNWVLPMAISICYFCICFLGWQPKIKILKLVKVLFLSLPHLFYQWFFTSWKAVVTTSLLYNNDLLNGFTWSWLYCCFCLSLAICFGFYSSYTELKERWVIQFAPLFIWTLINWLAVF
jgi:hypothetical protein